MSGFDACSVSSHCNFLPFSMLVIFSWYLEHDVLGKRNCCKDAFSNVVMRYEERKCSIVLQIDTSLLVSLCLWTVNFTSVSQLFSPTLGGTEWLKSAGVGYFRSQLSKALIIP